MARRIGRKRATDAVAMAQALSLAPMVVAMRLPLMAAEHGSTRPWATETARAVSEKNTALAEGMLAAQMSMLRSVWSFWPEVLSGRTPSMLNGVAAEQSINAALKPASRTVKANYRRLSSTR